MFVYIEKRLNRKKADNALEIDVHSRRIQSRGKKERRMKKKEKQQITTREVAMSEQKQLYCKYVQTGIKRAIIHNSISISHMHVPYNSWDGNNINVFNTHSFSRYNFSTSSLLHTHTRPFFSLAEYSLHTGKYEHKHLREHKKIKLQQHIYRRQNNQQKVNGEKEKEHNRQEHCTESHLNRMNENKHKNFHFIYIFRHMFIE